MLRRLSGFSQKKDRPRRADGHKIRLSRHYFFAVAFAVFAAFFGAFVAVFLSRFCFLLIFSRSRLINLLTSFTRVASFFSPNSCLYSARAPVSFSPISLRTCFLLGAVGFAVSC